MRRIPRSLTIMGAAVVATLLTGTVGFVLIEHYPAFDAFYMSLITIATVGHIADGNLHTLYVKPDEVLPEAWTDYAKKIYDEMTDIALRLGGVGSGEHGIGLLKKSIFLRTKSPAEIEIMRGIKKAFDPEGILNPGKII